MLQSFNKFYDSNSKLTFASFSIFIAEHYEL